MDSMTSRNTLITGTSGIDLDKKSRVSLSGSLRTPSDVVTGVSKRPIDTVSANEKSVCAPVDERLVAELFD
jgi:hypothetical protein